MTTAQLSAKQLESIRDATAPVNIWHGSVRSGKTLGSLVAFLDDIARTPRGAPGRTVIVGRTMDTVYRNVISGIFELLGPASEGVRYTRGSNVANILGHEVDILGASDARSETRIRGMTIRRAYVDEASLLPDLGYWSQLLNRQMTVGDSRTFATTNPEGPQHWLKTEVIDRADELGYKVWHFTLDDNPVLTEADKEAARARNSGVYYDRNILGLWVLAEGMIWQGFDRDRHIVDTLPPGLNGHLMGIDHGTTNPFAALVVARGIDPSDGQERLWVTSEYRHDSRATAVRKTDSEYAADLATFLDRPDQPALDRSRLEVHIDPSAAGFIEQMYRDQWRNAGAAHNDVSAGLSLVASLFALDRIRIHRSCAGLLAEIPGYVWDPKASKKGSDAPLKVNDHSCDAFRYAVWGHWRAWERWLTQPIVIPDRVRR